MTQKPISPVNVNSFHRELQYLHERRSAVDALIQQLEQYESDFINPDPGKPAKSKAIAVDRGLRLAS